MSQAKWVWIFGNFKLSETVVVSWIIIAALAIISFLLTRNLKKVPTSKVQIFLEFAIGGLDKMVKNTMGEKTVKRMPNIVPYIGSLFLFFACSNLIGLLGFTIKHNRRGSEAYIIKFPSIREYIRWSGYNGITISIFRMVINIDTRYFNTNRSISYTSAITFIL